VFLRSKIDKLLPEISVRRAIFPPQFASCIRSSSTPHVGGKSGANTLVGAAGNDTIDGGGGADRIDGGSGNDWLTGGAGVDTFLFASGSGSDRTVDFTTGSGSDVTNLSGLGFVNFTQVQAALSQSGSNVVLLLGGSDQILYANTTLANFNSANFTHLYARCRELLRSTASEAACFVALACLNVETIESSTGIAVSCVGRSSSLVSNKFSLLPETPETDIEIIQFL
jgi:hypothetical protein